MDRHEESSKPQTPNSREAPISKLSSYAVRVIPFGIWCLVLLWSLEFGVWSLFLMKVTIIGGGGRVGSCAAYALQCGGLVSEIQILDANKDLAEGEALDLYHGSAFAGDHKIYAGDYARAADTDIFVITAGIRRKPDESRLDLINRNVTLFVQIVESIKSAG